ncbi:MAG: arsenate reductase (glutaredoxin) [Woeseiaceae bacterium]|nr:arsenate reductase (glutaredoxin) [Woeseiaceae bacterium]
MSLTLYHNPRCSKSRKTLEIIRDKGEDPAIVLYLEATPSAAEILGIAQQLGIAVSGLLRRGESAFRNATDLPDLDDDVALAGWLEAHPIVIERPIVVDEDSGKAVIGRPPENVIALLS